MTDLDEALKLARETIASTAPESCDCDECKIARALLALAEQRTADEERADVVADLLTEVRSINKDLAAAIKRAHPSATHGEGEARSRIADKLARWADRVKQGQHVGAAAKETKT